MTYSWHRVDGDLPPGSLGQNSNTLTIVGATPTDEGMYYCMASKEKLRVESNRATLNVNGRGEFYSNFRLLLCKNRQSLDIQNTIKCVRPEYPPPG